MELDYYNCLFVFLRVSAFLLVLPFFSMTNFPPVMRVALSAFMTILLAPMLPPFALAGLPFFSLMRPIWPAISSPPNWASIWAPSSIR